VTVSLRAASRTDPDSATATRARSLASVDIDRLLLTKSFD
jgi:hypothetical protein